jgi:glycosyltransferase involved in cell wall biosynthesis
VYKEANALIHAGFTVTVVCRQGTTKLPENDTFEGIKIIRVLCPEPRQDSSRIVKLLRNSKNLRLVAEKLVELKPDIIHCHDLNSLSEGVKAAKRTKVPVIYDSHEDWPLLEYVKSNSKFVYRLTSFYEKRLLKKVSYRIVATPAQDRLIIPGKSIVLMNCPQKGFIDRGDPEPIIKKYKLKGKIVIIYHGGVGEKKGILELISSAEKLVKKLDNLRFLIIGGNFEKFLDLTRAKGLDKYFIFTGWTDYKKIPDYLKASDIDYSVLQPTRQYLVSIPTKIFEGMQAGIPVVGNKEFPALHEIVKKNNAGILVNSNVNEITSALEKLINDDTLRAKLGRNGKIAIQKEYNWETQAKKLVKFYKGIIKD